MAVGDNNREEESGFNVEAFKHAISMIESSGGKFLEAAIDPKTGKPSSTAAGTYHFLYRLIQKDPEMKGISKRDFINNPKLQERIMDKALNGNLAGYTYGPAYAKKLKKEFASDYDVNDLTAMIHFLGAGSARSFLKDPVNFKVPGAVNMTGDEYLKKFKGHFDKYNIDNPKKNIKEESIAQNSNISNQEKAQSVVQVNNTSVPKQRVPSQGGYDFIDTNSQETKTIPNQANTTQGYDFIDTSNKFKQGGQMDGQSGANQLVTMFEGGGSHEQNPYGGIPQGTGANGKPNLVEEGETKWNDYIFSNSYSLDGTYKGADGKSSNVFEKGGDLTEGSDNKKKDKKAAGPQPEGLSFTKSEMQNQVGGGVRKIEETFNVPNVRDQYINNNILNPNEVDFDKAIQDDSSREFFNRYNDPKNRSLMREQTGLTDEDIDNMILKGLNTRKEIGGVQRGKASFDRDNNTINISPEANNNKGVETHERVHSSMFDAAQGDNLMKILGNSFDQEGRGFLKKNDPDTLRELNKPHEAYGNFAEFREQLGLKPGEQITEEQLKKRAKAKGLDMNNFYRSFSDKNVTKALNTIAQSGSNNINDYKLS